MAHAPRFFDDPDQRTVSNWRRVSGLCRSRMSTKMCEGPTPAGQASSILRARGLRSQAECQMNSP
eukprot:10197150-Heterocapsa_arctica.AAC.1